MVDYLNLNGLVNGLIPAGDACPFLAKCDLYTSFCPDGSNRSKDFSCAAARAFPLVALRKSSTVRLPTGSNS